MKKVVGNILIFIAVVGVGFYVHLFIFTWGDYTFSSEILEKSELVENASKGLWGFSITVEGENDEENIVFLIVDSDKKAAMKSYSNLEIGGFVEVWIKGNEEKSPSIFRAYKK